MSLRREIDPRLDALYNRTVRCPYCGSKILKFTTTCEKCGITKKQILDASNTRAKEVQNQKIGGRIIKTKNRPDDVTFTKMAIYTLLFGLFGTHNFYIGRKIRGFVMLVSVLICVAFWVPLYLNPSWRQSFQNVNLVFPTDVLGLIAFMMWVIDSFAVVFGWYKYPVRLGEPDLK